jgi:hypothetical protein
VRMMFHVVGRGARAFEVRGGHVGEVTVQARTWN